MIKKYFFIFVALISNVYTGSGQMTEGFENGLPINYTPNTSYLLNSGTWEGSANQVIENSAIENVQSGLKSLQLRSETGASIISPIIVSGGLGTVTFHSKSSTSSGRVQVNYRIDGGNWIAAIGSPFTLTSTMTQYTATINEVSNNIEFRFRRTESTVYIDDIETTPYGSTSYVDYCNLQYSQNGNITVGSRFNVYAQAYKVGITETEGPSAGIRAWIGYNTKNTNPNNLDWIWIPAIYNAQIGNNDEYVANLGAILSSGTYYYASRFQIDDGPHRYGGYSESGGGFWDGTSNVSGVLSIDSVDFCNLQFPSVGSISLGEAFAVYGQVYEKGVTPGIERGSGIIAEIGYNTINSNPTTWTNWISGNYNGTCNDCNLGQNDEYSADLGNAITTAGTYYYATRFSLNGGAWLYGGILANGTSGNFWDGTTFISGILTVMGTEIKVEGNVGTFPEIRNGDTTPQGTDGTQFAAQYIGASQSKSYRIRNLGNLDLNVYSVTIGGVNAADFKITETPDMTIPPGAFSLLEIEFSPTEQGSRNAIISIVNNDSDENPYTFAIRGTGLCVASNNIISPSSGTIGTIATITGSHFAPSTLAYINGILMPTTYVSFSTVEVTIPPNSTTGNIVIENSIGCTSTTSFTVLNNRLGGCEGTAFLSDLIISEITDATIGGLSYVEIYNGTGAIIALEDYFLGIYYNGASNPGNTIGLSAVNLPNNETYIVALGTTASTTPGNTCSQFGGNGELASQKSTVGAINKKDNAHDVIRLLKSGGTVVVDQFGVYKDKNWMDATIITGDRGFNFRRLNTATLLPNPEFNLNDWNIIDWVGSGSGSCGTNDYSDIGFYDYSGGNPPSIIIQPIAPESDCALTTTLTVFGAEGLTGGLPLAYQWYYNAPETNDWLEILNTDPNYAGQQSESLNILNTTILDSYQYYVQVRENTLACYSSSNAVRLKIDTTTWDGLTWNPTAPDDSTVVILNGNYTTNPTTSSFESCSLIVNSGYTLNITNDYYVAAMNDVIVHGNLMVETKGAFVQKGDGSHAGTFITKNSGTSLVNKSTAIKQNWYDYTYWSSPVTNETVESVLSMANPSRRFYFEAANYEDTNGDDIDDNGDDWQLATGRMIPGVGYASTSNKSGTFPRIDHTQFNGEFNTGDISVPIYTNNITTDKDWNFIGNPYASAIDFKLVHSENTSTIAGAAYLWSQTSPPLVSNPGNQVHNFNQNDYAIICLGSGNIAGGKDGIPSDFISSGQGFFIIGMNSGGTLTFKNSMRVADNSSNSQFFKNNSTELPNKFWINLTSDNGVFNQILVAYVEGATNGVDGFSYDVERNLSSGLSAIIYTEIPESTKKYAIQGKSINSLSLDEQISIGFKSSISQPTLYKLSIAQLQGSFFDENKLFIRDNLLKTLHDLSLSDYHFTSVTGDFNDRFVIVFKNETLSINNFALDSKALTIIELSNGEVQFSIQNNLRITSVEIIDLLGRSLYFLKGNSATEVFDLSSLSQAAYIAKVELSNGQILIKRAVKRH